MKLVVCVLGALWTLSCPQLAFTKPCVTYDGSTHTIIGTIIAHQGLRTWYALLADQPICVTASDKEGPFSASHNALREFHLLEPNDKTNLKELATSKQRVSIDGYFTPQVTGYHETPVLLNCRSIRRLAESATSQAQTPVNEDSKQSEMPPAYSFSVTVNPQAARVLTSAWVTPTNLLRPENLYVTYFFNGPKDILWVTCSTGYALLSPRSTTGSRVFRLDDTVESDGTGGVAVDFVKITNISGQCRRGDSSRAR